MKINGVKCTVSTKNGYVVVKSADNKHSAEIKVTTTTAKARFDAVAIMKTKIGA